MAAGGTELRSGAALGDKPRPTARIRGASEGDPAPAQVRPPLSALPWRLLRRPPGSRPARLAGGSDPRCRARRLRQSCQRRRASPHRSFPLTADPRLGSGQRGSPEAWRLGRPSPRPEAPRCPLRRPHPPHPRHRPGRHDHRHRTRPFARRARRRCQRGGQARPDHAGGSARAGRRQPASPGRRPCPPRPRPAHVRAQRLRARAALRAHRPPRLRLGKPKTRSYRNSHRVDFWFEELGLVVETDGLRYHRTPAQQSRDLRRDQDHAAAGQERLRFSHWQVKYEPDRVGEVLAAVAARLRGSRPHAA